MSLKDELSLRWCGDEYLRVGIGETMSLGTIADVLRARQALMDSALRKYIVDSAPGWCSLLLRLEAWEIDARAVEKMVSDALERACERAVAFPSRTITIPVCYGGEFGPDLQFVAQVNEVSVDDAIKRLEQPQFVGLVCFIPGQPACMWMDPSHALSAPKYENPRTHTPVGTVGLGGSSICPYPLDSPGGFQMVGRMAVPIYSPEAALPAFVEDPVLIRAGDRVSFESISEAEYARLAAEVAAGTYQYRMDAGTCEIGVDGGLTWTP